MTEDEAALVLQKGTFNDNNLIKGNLIDLIHYDLLRNCFFSSCRK